MKFVVSSLLAVVLVAVNAPAARAQSDILASATRLASTVELEQEPGSVVRRMRSTTLTLLGVGALALGAAFAILPPDCGKTPDTGVEGLGSVVDKDGIDKGHFFLFTYTPEFRNGRCDIAVDVKVNSASESTVYFGIADTTYYRDPARKEFVIAYKSYSAGYGNRVNSSGPGYLEFNEGGLREYYHDIRDSEGFIVREGHFKEMKPTRSDARRKLGIGVAIGGAIALVSGLWRVERELRESVDVPFRVGVTPDGGVLATRSIKW